MDKQVFNIGDTVWFAGFGHRSVWVKCPDCLGSKHLTVIFADGQKVTIDCAGCSRGYEPPIGVVEQYETSGKVEELVVAGVRREDDRYRGRRVDYTFSGGTVISEEYVFATEAEAIEKGKVRAAEWLADENKRLLAKTKNHRTWAWNAHYHRDKIRQLEKEIAYHRAKLDAASQYVKAEKVRPEGPSAKQEGA